MRSLAIDGSGEPDDDLCGSGYYRKFVADEIPYVAWASFGPDVSEEDRAIALDALTLAGGGFIGGAEPALPRRTCSRAPMAGVSSSRPRTATEATSTWRW